MTTDFRAELQALVSAYDEHGGSWSPHHEDAWFTAVKRARAALAEPEPEGPTKAELRQVFDDQSGYIDDEQVMWWSDFYAAARAVLARWGSS